MFAPEELIIMPSDSWKLPDMRIEIPPPAASFEEMEMSVRHGGLSDSMRSTLRPVSPASEADTASILEAVSVNGGDSEEEDVVEADIQHSDIQHPDIYCDSVGREYVTITVFGSIERCIEVTGMNDEEISWAIEVAYDEAALEFALECPDEDRHMYM